MTDFLDQLVEDAKATVESGYYEVASTTREFQTSLKNEILQNSRAAVIAEVKGASPSKGIIRKNFAPEEVAREMAKGGATGISVLTEPKHFDGSLKNLQEVRNSVEIPVLMKDIILSPLQVEAASNIGANAVLLIQAVFDRKYGQLSLNEMITKAQSKNLEVLLETHSPDEFNRAVKTKADLIGINNRNLGTLKIDLNTTKDILLKCAHENKVIVSESGINTPSDLRFLRKYGAQAFLIGSAIMESENVENKVKEFANS